MRTKTMILSATCGLLGALAAQADSVYSVNVVGYVNKTFTANTYTLIGNPLNSSNTLASLFPNLTDADQGVSVYVWSQAKADFNYYVYMGSGFGGWVDDSWTVNENNVVLAPGQGFWLYVINDTSVTFVGDVLQGTQSVPIATGWTQVASPVPQAGSLVALGLTNPSDGDWVYSYAPATVSGWKTWIYSLTDFGGWVNSDTYAPEEPQIGVGEALWYNSYAGFTWTRTFNVN